MGILNQPDARLYRSYFKEMSKLIGIPVTYKYPVFEDPTIHAEIKCEYSDGIKMDIVFETNPKIATLKAIGWISEFKDDKPYIAMLPYDAPHLQSKCMIELDPIYSVGDRGRKFEITSINTLYEYPDCYICTLAPFVKNDNEVSEIKNDYEESNFNHINYEKIPNVYEQENTELTSQDEAEEESTNSEQNDSSEYFSYFKW